MPRVDDDEEEDDQKRVTESVNQPNRYQKTKQRTIKKQEAGRTDKYRGEAACKIIPEAVS